VPAVRRTCDASPVTTSSHRILIAPDSFKGSLAPAEVAVALATGWRMVRPTTTSCSYRWPTAVRGRSLPCSRR